MIWSFFDVPMSYKKKSKLAEYKKKDLQCTAFEERIKNFH
jgi:hypothetical protein